MVKIITKDFEVVKAITITKKSENIPLFIYIIKNYIDTRREDVKSLFGGKIFLGLLSKYFDNSASSTTVTEYEPCV